jgi:hypothetical protein
VPGVVEAHGAGKPDALEERPDPDPRSISATRLLATTTTTGPIERAAGSMLTEGRASGAAGELIVHPFGKGRTAGAVERVARPGTPSFLPPVVRGNEQVATHRLFDQLLFAPIFFGGSALAYRVQQIPVYPRPYPFRALTLRI